jgi:formylglycine-generating enzyme required for sulfatase activity
MGPRFAAAPAALRKEVRSPGSLRIGTVFRDCSDCPELVWLPQGEFAMGATAAGGYPGQLVSIGYSLAVGRFEVTFAEWDACVDAGGCRRRPRIRLGPRLAAGHQRQLVGRAAVRRWLARPYQTLPAAERSRVGIRRARAAQANYW